MSRFRVRRYHDISAGHRVTGHESKCQHLHGHNYRVYFTCESDGLDELGRVIDFGVVKEKLCMWLEDNWDHKFLAWGHDPVMLGIVAADKTDGIQHTIEESIVWLPFNPTAENMAEYLVNTVGPSKLKGTGVKLVEVLIEETAKCHATYTLEEK